MFQINPNVDRRLIYSLNFVSSYTLVFDIFIFAPTKPLRLLSETNCKL